MIDERRSIAAAVRAIDAAMAACESARLALLTIATPEPEPLLQSGECRHPESQWQAALTFGDSVYFCGVCGEQVGV